MAVPRSLPHAEYMNERNAAPRRSGSSDPVIDVQNLQKVYGSVAAVDGISFSIERGEIFALLGPNGAGKSTTVEILEGYRARTGGHVRVLGTDPGEPNRAWRSQIGIVLQSSKITDEISVLEALSLTASYFGSPRPPRDVVELVGLAEKTNVRVSKLSGGQQRRLDVGLAIIGRPELLFLDEPTTGFDPEARRHFWSLIEMLRDEGTTILLTTHYLDEAEVLADRVGVIASGRMIDIATPERLGGRDRAMAIVRWKGANGHEQCETHSPTQVVVDLATQFAGDVPELSVTRPSLEDTYLHMIGEVSK
jgi:ABC-2 type transport system ATP-binding protein